MTSRYSRPSEASALRKARIVNMTSLTGSLAGCALGHNKAALIWAGADGSHSLGSALPADSSAFYPASGETAPVGVLRGVPAGSVVAQGAAGTSPARPDMSAAGPDPSQRKKRKKNACERRLARAKKAAAAQAAEHSKEHSKEQPGEVDAAPAEPDTPIPEPKRTKWQKYRTKCNAQHSKRRRERARVRKAEAREAAQAMEHSEEQAMAIDADGNAEFGVLAGEGASKVQSGGPGRLVSGRKDHQLTPGKLADMDGYQRALQSAGHGRAAAVNGRYKPRGRAPPLLCNPMFGPALSEPPVASTSSHLGSGGGEDELWTLASRQEHEDV